jgi:hypothetical protein
MKLKIRLFFMIDMFRFYLILVVRQDLLDQQKTNDDEQIRLIYNQEWTLQNVLIFNDIEFD